MTTTSPPSHYRDSGLWYGAWTASSRIIHCVNHALHFLPPRACCRGRQTELPDRSRWLATAMPCPALLLLLPQSQFRCGTPVVHAGRCRTEGKKRGPCQPCHHPGPACPTPKEGPQPADRPTAIGERRSFSSAHDKTPRATTSFPPPARLPLACHSRQVRRYPWQDWGPGNLANGIRSQPARWEAGTTLIHRPRSHLLPSG